MSPVTDARWPREKMLTQQWQGSFAFDHRVDGDFANLDLLHCRFLPEVTYQRNLTNTR
jgi:hypothetical protein